MGIKTGASTLVKSFSQGLYHKNAPHYNVYVDGEMMRYKGMFEENMVQSDPESSIACSSFEYVRRTVEDIVTLMNGLEPKSVNVFMDGQRIGNKEIRTAVFPFDASRIRSTFKIYCKKEHYNVQELGVGESELQMYLQRDITSPLNIFVTGDSDMVSICYGHEPTVLGDSDEYSIEPRRYTGHGIVDSNSIYTQGTEVLDSCMWVNTGKYKTAIGFDFVDDKFLFTVRVFRTFIALCGTDFTKNLFTDSMIKAILHSPDGDRNYINSLTDFNEIAVALLILGVRGGGTLKRGCASKGPKYNADDLTKTMRIYLDYITSGLMGSDRIPTQNMNKVCRHFVYALTGQNERHTKATLTKWLKRHTIAEALENFNRFLGTWDEPKRVILEIERPTTPPLEEMMWRDTVAVQQRHPKRKSKDDSDVQNSLGCDSASTNLDDSNNNNLNENDNTNNDENQEEFVFKRPRHQKLVIENYIE